MAASRARRGGWLRPRAAGALAALLAARLPRPADGGSGAVTGKLPPAPGGHPGWIVFMSNEGLHRMDADGNETTLMVPYSAYRGNSKIKPPDCPPTGIGIDQKYGIAIWSCGDPYDDTNRHVFRSHYTWNPPEIEEVDFTDNGLRGGVAVDAHTHRAFVSIHEGKGWRVQVMPLKGCYEFRAQTECTKHADEGCGWAGGLCSRSGTGNDIIQARTDWLEGAGLTVAAGNLEFSFFVPPDSATIVKAAEDGSGRMTKLEKVTELWEKNSYSSSGDWHIGHCVATHDLEPDSWIHLAAVADGRARIYRVDPKDGIDPENYWDLSDAPWRSAGTTGTSTPFNMDGAPQPAFATLWDYHEIIYSTGKTLAKRHHDNPAQKKDILTASASMGNLGPLVWYPHDGKSPPSAAPTQSPVKGPEPTAAPTGAPAAAGTPTGAPAQAPVAAAASPTTAPAPPTAGDPPTTAPVAGDQPSKAPQPPAAPGPTTAPVPETAPPQKSSGNATAPEPSDGSGSEAGGGAPVMLIVIIAAAVLCLVSTAFYIWYKRAKVKKEKESKGGGEIELVHVEDDEEGVSERTAPLAQVASEAMPLGADEFKRLGDEYKHKAGVHLRQLRHGEHPHEPEDDAAHSAEADRAYVAELESQRRARDESYQVLDLAKAEILARMRGDEVDRAMDQWVEEQWRDDDDEDEDHRRGSGSGHAHHVGGTSSTRSRKKRPGVVTIAQSPRGLSSAKGRSFRHHHGHSVGTPQGEDHSNHSFRPHEADRVSPPHRLHHTGPHRSSPLSHHIPEDDDTGLPPLGGQAPHGHHAHDHPHHSGAGRAFRRIDQAAHTTSALDGQHRHISPPGQSSVRSAHAMPHGSFRRATHHHHRAQPVFAAQSPRGTQSVRTPGTARI
eukprot:TRINITY_DN55909_c0_g1_i1.p1 TRINITY_DN55909_c0_g1~~TRINITY_DN55909_c0_g1_i1.p1  ORF type:complete len:916 (+),score=197.91 TRINITY_DN55909_c0_g1_i1:82-2748(+)